MTTQRTSCVDVCVRVRPLRPEIHESGTAWEISTQNHTIQQRSNPDVRFTFDHIFSPTEDTTAVYKRMVEHTVLRNVLSGFNATAFVYGQTGSGKSHTMLGPDGVVPTIVRDVFSRSEGTLLRNPRTEKLVFSVSMLEIYNEQLKDLLVGPADQRLPLSIRESKLHGVYVHNAVVRRVGSAEQLLHAIQHEAEVRRVSATTAMNEHSSRSHFIIRLEIEKIEYFDDGQDEEEDSSEESEADDANVKRRTYTILNLVDLAGSERVANTGAVGIRLVEGGSINKSLTILTTVIQRLSEYSQHTTSRVDYVPYRDSKLTHMLKSALGGNSFTTVIACVSIADQQVDESRSTLQFASRAKTIKNSVTLNQLSNGQNDRLVQELNIKVATLKKRLLASNFYCWSAQLRCKAAVSQTASSTTGEAEDHAAQVTQLQSVIQQLVCENDELRHKCETGEHRTDDTSGPRLKDLEQQVSELQSQNASLLSEHRDMQDMLQELEELCEDLERDNTDKEKTIARLMKPAAAALPPQAKSVPTPDLVREIAELKEQLENERKDSARYLGFTKRFLVLSKMVLGTRPAAGVVPDDASTGNSSSFAGELQVDHAVRSLTSFIQSRLNAAPAVVRSGLEGATSSVSPARPYSEGSVVDPSVAQLKQHIQELEDKMKAIETQKDIVTDVKLKRMQDLVLRMHTRNLALQEELACVVHDGAILRETILSDSKVAKSMRKKLPETLLSNAPTLDSIMARVVARPNIEKPNGHN
eukprot:PhM_4_TR11648/c0_g1_i1/m.68260/K11498/CENPE; centromeric protein E